MNAVPGVAIDLGRDQPACTVLPGYGHVLLVDAHPCQGEPIAVRLVANTRKFPIKDGGWAQPANDDDGSRPGGPNFISSQRPEPYISPLIVDRPLDERRSMLIYFAGRVVGGNDGDAAPVAA